jgi:hypothetical protein
MRNWILPAFTTTTKVDEAVAGIIFMGTLQKYYTYSWGTRCGLPSVTLQGEVEDWEEIRERAKKLATFGKEPNGISCWPLFWTDLWRVSQIQRKTRYNGSGSRFALNISQMGVAPPLTRVGSQHFVSGTNRVNACMTHGERCILPGVPYPWVLRKSR